MSKQTNINARLKDHFRHISLYLEPMNKEFLHRNYGQVVSFSYENTLSFEFRLLFRENNQELPLEDQRMIVYLRDKKQEVFTKDYTIDEAKKVINDLISLLAKTCVAPLECPYPYAVSIPKIKHHLFGIEYDQKDSEKFKNMLRQIAAQTQNETTKREEAENAQNEAQRRFDFEFRGRSKQSEIDVLRETLARMEKEEAELVEELSKKHNLTHLENITKGCSAKRYSNIKDGLKSAAKIIHEHELNVDFYEVESIFGIKL